jgi:hypothetical protein
MFPPNDSMTRRPLPSTGSSWGEFPRFAGTTRRSDSLRTFPPPFVFLRLAVPFPVRLLSSLPSGPTPTREPGALGLAAPRQLFREWSRRVSQVPGQLSRTYARVLDPGGTDMPGQYGMPTRPPDCNTPRAPATTMISGLDVRASVLAVYASWCGSPHRCTQDSLPAAGQLCRVGLGYPQSYDERFQ